MLVLIDESGDTGFKEGSSRFFFLTMVVFEDGDGQGQYPQAEYTAETISKAKQDSEHKSEFHFSQCSIRVREAFFEALNRGNCDFSVYSLVVDKKQIHSPHLKKTRHFYNFMLKQLLMRNPIERANIKIDGDKSKSFRGALRSYIKNGNPNLARKIKFVDSKNDFLIQLADMSCGAIAYSYKDKIESDKYTKLLGTRIKDVWEFK